MAIESVCYKNNRRACLLEMLCCERQLDKTTECLPVMSHCSGSVGNAGQDAVCINTGRDVELSM
jgi:hypothetical protein